MSSLFDSGETIAKSSADIVRLFYLMADERVSMSYVELLSCREGTSDYERGLRVFRASLNSLLVRCKTRIDEKSDKLKAVDYEFKFDKIKDLIDADDLDKNVEAMYLLNKYLESDLKLTDIASQQSYDRKNPFLSNKVKGFK